MLRAFFSNIFPTLRHASVEISERATFIRGLDAWVEESPPEERDSRNRAAIELTEAFDTNSSSFLFQGNISSLPRCIGKLSSLQELHLSWCTSLRCLPPEIGNLSALEDLILNGCWTLTSLPLEIGNLHALQTLQLNHCVNLASLPPEIGNLSALQNLFVTVCTSLSSLPSEIGNLFHLKCLDLSHCTGLTYLPPETITLKDLHPLERKEFFEIFEKFLALFRRLHQHDYIQNESIASGSGVLEATGRFVKAFKERLIEKRLQNMHKELSKTNDAVASLQEDPQTADTLKADDRGLALPLIILESFVAEDARVRCLRLQQDREDRLLQKRNLISDQ